MSRRSTAIATTLAAVFCVSACGCGTNRSPAAPSTAVSVAQGTGTSGPNIGASSVSWSCFTRATGTTGTFGSSGCPAARVATSRFLPAAGAALSAPAAPTGLSGTVSGSIVTLTWTAPAGGDPPASYLVQAGSSAGLTDLASFDTGTTATSLAVFNVPAATYFIRIRATNSAGTSGPSNEFQLVVTAAAPCGSLSAPTGLLASVTGSTVVLTWATPSGCAPTSYIIQAGSTPGASNLANFSTGSTATTFTATDVGAGTYYIRVLGVNAAGQSPASAEIVVTVGPAAPVTLIASFQLFDPATQAAVTNACRINSGIRSTCELRSTSFPFGANTIVTWEWTVQYTYGTVKTITQSGSSPSLFFSDTCGGDGSTADGVAQPLAVTLTVTDNLGAKATATAGSGSQPALQIRLFTC